MNNDDVAKKLADIEALLNALKDDISVNAPSEGVEAQDTTKDEDISKSNAPQEAPQKEPKAETLQKEDVITPENSQTDQNAPTQQSKEVDLKSSPQGEIVIPTAKPSDEKQAVPSPTDDPQPSSENKQERKEPVNTEVKVKNPQTAQPNSPETTVAAVKEPTVREESTGKAQLKEDSTLPSEEEEKTGPPIGEVGVFDGEFVNMPNDKRYQVPPNYASKAKLVMGDELKLMSHGDQNEFKIVKQVDRAELKGILTKKEYLWTAVVGKFEFKLISAAVRYYGGDIGDNVIIIVPADYEKTGPAWAALVGVEKTDVGKGGYAGSQSASDIEAAKRMKYVPKREPSEQKSESPRVEQGSEMEKPKPFIPVAANTTATPTVIHEKSEQNPENIKEVPTDQVQEQGSEKLVEPISNDTSSSDIEGITPLR